MWVVSLWVNGKLLPRLRELSQDPLPIEMWSLGGAQPWEAQSGLRQQLFWGWTQKVLRTPRPPHQSRNPKALHSGGKSSGLTKNVSHRKFQGGVSLQRNDIVDPTYTVLFTFYQTRLPIDFEAQQHPPALKSDINGLLRRKTPTSTVDLGGAIQ